MRRVTLAYAFPGVKLPACASAVVYHLAPDVYPLPVVDLAWYQSVAVTRSLCVRRNHSRLVRDRRGRPIGYVKCRPEQDPR